MIRYDAQLDALVREVDALKPAWRKKARTATGACQKKKKYVDCGSIWSDIKDVFRKLQHNKCAYCERYLPGFVATESGRLRLNPGAVEHDIEHFRPKGRITRWPTKKMAEALKINFTMPLGGAATKGYYLLAFHLQNYATACKECNSALKRDYFPIAGKRKVTGQDPGALGTEKPYLVFPLGSWDEDPMKLITFDGELPKPVAARGFRRHRAVLTITFFLLDIREELLRERCEVIDHMFLAFDRATNSGDAEIRAAAKDSLRRLVAPASRHSNCAAAFLEQLKDDNGRARELWRRADEYLKSMS